MKRWTLIKYVGTQDRDRALEYLEEEYAKEVDDV